MQLIRFDGNKTGLVVELASGIHVVDVIASVGALVPEDPISHGILNGLLKADGSWDGISSLDIRESDDTAQDPTGQDVIERQFAESSVTTGLPGQGNQFESRNRSEAVLLTVQFGEREGKPRESR
jgi:hypothetical protein